LGLWDNGDGRSGYICVSREHGFGAHDMPCLDEGKIRGIAKFPCFKQVCPNMSSGYDAQVRSVFLPLAN